MLPLELEVVFSRVKESLNVTVRVRSCIEPR